MHVGLNLAFLVPGEAGGQEVVARELLPELARTGVRLTAFVSREAAAAHGPWHDLECVTVPASARNRLEWVRADQQLVPRLARRAGVDVLHSLASTGPAWGAFARVVTIHDLIYRLHPDTHAGWRARGMALLVPLAARRSHRVIAVSHATRDDLVRELRISADRIDVVHNGAGITPVHAPTAERELRDRLGLGDRRVILTLSAKRPHKNLPRLLDALALIPAPERPVLVLPGYATWHEDELAQRARTLGIDGDVRLAGWVDGADLEGLYALADCFVFPSLYEGFGMPVVEAMRRGVPVACSDRGALREVTGDAARRFDPSDPAAIAGAIGDVLSDDALAQRLRAAGREQAAGFSWERAARETLASYERALRGMS